MAIKFAIGKNAKDRKPQQKVVETWIEYLTFIKSLRKPFTEKTKLPYIWGDMLDLTGTRSLTNAGNRHVLYLDMDGCSAETWKLFEPLLRMYQCYAYTTASHQQNAQRWRIGFMLSREVTAHEYQQLGVHVERLLMDDYELFGEGVIKWDRSVFNPAMMVFAPHDKAQFVEYHGKPINVDLFEFTEEEERSVFVQAVGINPYIESDLRSALWHPEMLKLATPGVGLYSEWIAMGCRLASFIGTEFEDNARELWIEWSMAAGGSAEDIQVAQGRWDDGKLTPDRTGYAAIFSLAQSKGWKNPAGERIAQNSIVSSDDFEDLSIKSGFTDINDNVLKHFEERFVHIKCTDRIYDLQSLSFFPSVSGFKNFMAPYKIPDGKKTRQVTQMWLDNPKKLIAEDLVFVPNGERLIEKNGLTYINTYREVIHTPAIANDKLHIFLDHMNYLAPDEFERDYFIARLAWMVQRPERRCPVTILHTSDEHGTGRGWVTQVMERVLGDWNTSRVKMYELFDSPYQNYLHETLLCTIDEVYDKSKRFEINDQIRDILTEPRLDVNIKYGKKGVQNIYTNFLLYTNHYDALVLPPEDRRIAVISGPDFRKDSDYYDLIYTTLNSPDFISQVYEYLKGIDLNKFDFQRAPHTKARKLMVEHTTSDLELAINDMLVNPAFDAMTYPQILRDLNINQGLEINYDSRDAKMVARVTKLLKMKLRTSPIRLKIKGTHKRMWILNKTKTFTNEELRDLYDQIEATQNSLT